MWQIRALGAMRWGSKRIASDLGVAIMIVKRYRRGAAEGRFSKGRRAGSRRRAESESACRPYRARTKGKTERGVGYAKHNALAGRQFASWAALEAHLVLVDAEGRRARPRHDARGAACSLRARRVGGAAPLPTRPIPVRQRRERRKVASDCFVDVDTVRYSVPHRLVGRMLEVVVGDNEVVVFDGAERVARHARCKEPHQRVVDAAHFEGLHRVTASTRVTSTVLAPYGRSLADYAARVGGTS